MTVSDATGLPVQLDRLALLPARLDRDAAGETDGAGVIYDIRHVTTYNYESPVSFARCSLRLEPVSSVVRSAIASRCGRSIRPSSFSAGKLPM